MPNFKSCCNGWVGEFAKKLVGKTLFFCLVICKDSNGQKFSVFCTVIEFLITASVNSVFEKREEIKSPVIFFGCISNQCLACKITKQNPAIVFLSQSLFKSFPVTHMRRELCSKITISVFYGTSFLGSFPVSPLSKYRVLCFMFYVLLRLNA